MTSRKSIVVRIISLKADNYCMVNNFLDFIANLRQVKVYYNNLNPFYNYQFAIASIEPEPSWKSVAKSIREGEVESFYLYTKSVFSSL